MIFRPRFVRKDGGEGAKLRKTNKKNYVLWEYDRLSTI